MLFEPVVCEEIDLHVAIFCFLQCLDICYNHSKGNYWRHICTLIPFRNWKGEQYLFSIIPSRDKSVADWAVINWRLQEDFIAYLLFICKIWTIKLFMNRRQIRFLNSKTTDLDWHYSRPYQKLKFLIRDLLFTTLRKPSQWPSFFDLFLQDREGVTT